MDFVPAGDVLMGNSWIKRHSPQIQGRGGDTIDRTEGQRRYGERYHKWEASHIGPNGKRLENPLKAGDSWNPRLKCWNNEVFRDERYPEGHKRQGELTVKGERLARRST